MRQFKVNNTLNFRLALFLLMLSFSIPSYARDYDIFSFDVNYCDFVYLIHDGYLEKVPLALDGYKNGELIISLDPNEKRVASFAIKGEWFYIDGYDNNNETIITSDKKKIRFSVKNNKRGIKSIEFLDDSLLYVSEFDLLASLFLDELHRARKIYLYYNDGSEREYELNYIGSDDQAINKKWDKLWVSLVGTKLRLDYGENFIVSKEQDVFIIYDKTTEKYGACDPNGKLIIPIEFDFISFYDYHFRVDKKNKKQKAIFDKNGKAITPFISCDWLQIMWWRLNDQNIFFAIDIEKSGKHGVIDYNGNLIIPIEYKSVNLEWGGDKLYFSVNKGKNKYGAYSLSGELLVEPKYRFLKYENDNFIYHDKNYNSYNTGIKLP